MSDCILLLDDEPHILSALQRLLRQGLRDSAGQSYKVEAFTDSDEALARAGEFTMALAITDYRMPKRNGVEFLLALRDLQPDCGRIILSGYTDLNAVVSAINDAEISRFIAKPWRDFELLSAVRQVLQVRELQMENKRLADEVRIQRGALSAQDAEVRRLELLEPGITRVKWGEDGSFILEDPGRGHS